MLPSNHSEEATATRQASIASWQCTLICTSHTCKPKKAAPASSCCSGGAESEFLHTQTMWETCESAPSSSSWSSSSSSGTLSRTFGREEMGWFDIRSPRAPPNEDPRERACIAENAEWREAYLGETSLLDP